MNLLRFMSTESVMASNHLILCHPIDYISLNLSSHTWLVATTFNNTDLQVLISQKNFKQTFTLTFQICLQQ